MIVAGLALLIGLTFANALRAGLVLDNQFIIGGDPRRRAVSWEDLRAVAIVAPLPPVGLTAVAWHARRAGWAAELRRTAEEARCDLAAIAAAWRATGEAHR